VTNPATITSDREDSEKVLHRHLDYFIVILQTLLIYQVSAIWTTLSWHVNPEHLPGLCKNHEIARTNSTAIQTYKIDLTTH